MQKSDVVDAPVIGPAGLAGNQAWRQEYAAFVRLIPELLKAHAGKFVAVHHGGVVAVADTFKDAALAAYQRVGYVPLHVGLVSEQSLPPVRMASPRVVRRAASA